MVWLRLSVVLLALALQSSFPARTPETLRQRYGEPTSETFLIRPGIVVSATYGPSRATCELIISPKEPDVVLRKWPGSGEINYDVLEGIEDELVPKPARGKYKVGTVPGYHLPPGK